MDVLMESKSFNSYQKIYSGEKMCKLSADTVIPDTFDDISRLLTTEFKCKIISKDVNFGKITINGEIEANTLFVPENSDIPETVLSSIPFNAEFSADDVDSSSIAVASMNVVAADWRELNPRKFGVNADVLVEVKAYSRTELSFPAVQPDDCERIFYKSENRIIKNISLVSEKLASIEDEHEIPDSSAILSTVTDCIFDSSELVGNRLIVKGHTHSRIIYRKQSGEVASLEYDTAFSQLFDHDDGAEIADCDCYMMPAGEYYEINGNMLNMELRIVLQLICYESRDLTYISDAYSCGCEYELSTDEKSVISERETLIKMQNIQLSYDLPEGYKSICISNACAGKMTVSGTAVNVPIIINAISSGADSGVFSFRVRGNAEFEDIICENLKAYVDNVGCAVIGGAAQFEATVKLKGACDKSESLAAVSAISVNVEVNKNISPSVIIARAESGDVWDIAKKYGADQNRVAEINSIQDGEDIKGRMLLIPKA